jgi:monovalent cation/hydrogen antiporter
VVANLDVPSLRRAIGYAAVISAVAIVVRILWVFPATYGPRVLSRRLRQRDPNPPWRSVSVVAWTGMRGIVSLAAALALPLTLADGVTPFPHRDLILFITFGVILATLVLQGLTLPAVIRGLHVGDLVEERDEEEITARYLSALAAVERLDNLDTIGPAAKERLRRMRAQYDERVAYYSRQLTPAGDGDGNSATAPEAAELLAACETGEQIEREAIAAERQMVVRLRDQGVIGDEVMRRIQAELDHEETRLTE